MSTLVEKLGALAKKLRDQGNDITKGHPADRAWATDMAARIFTLLVDHAKEGEGDPLMVHQLEQVRRNWRHWQQRAEIAEERLAERPAPAAPDALRALAQEVWDSVPADYSGPMVERHAAALNALGAALAPRKEGEG